MGSYIDQINHLLQSAVDLSDQVVKIVRNAPLPEDRRRREVAEVYGGASDIIRALKVAKKAHQGGKASTPERIEQLLSKLLDATRSSDIAKIPTPLRVRRDCIKPQKEYLSFFARTSYLPGTLSSVEQRNACV